MHYVISAVVGYLLGCVNPAAIASKIKNRDLRTLGTGNLGTTNTVMNFGKRWGAFVLAVDVMKAYIAVKLIQLVYPEYVTAKFVAGFAAVLGHCFPFYLNFRGGKGLASFAGFVLAADPLTFVILICVGLVLVILANYSFVLPFSASALFPFVAYGRTHSLGVFCVAFLTGALIIAKHYTNMQKAREGKDIRVRDYFKKYVFSRKDGK